MEKKKGRKGRKKGGRRGKDPWWAVRKAEPRDSSMRPRLPSTCLSLPLGEHGSSWALSSSLSLQHQSRLLLSQLFHCILAASHLDWKHPEATDCALFISVHLTAPGTEPCMLGKGGRCPQILGVTVNAHELEGAMVSFLFFFPPSTMSRTL